MTKKELENKNTELLDTVSELTETIDNLNEVIKTLNKRIPKVIDKSKPIKSSGPVIEY